MKNLDKRKLTILMIAAVISLIMGYYETQWRAKSNADAANTEQVETVTAAESIVQEAENNAALQAMSAEEKAQFEKDVSRAAELALTDLKKNVRNPENLTIQGDIVVYGTEYVEISFQMSAKLVKPVDGTYQALVDLNEGKTTKSFMETSAGSGIGLLSYSALTSADINRKKESLINSGCVITKLSGLQ